MNQALAALVTCVVLFLGGFTFGKSHERGNWQERLAIANAERDVMVSRVTGLSEGLARVQQERDTLAATLEEIANEDVDAGRVALPARSVRRIGSR